MTSGRREGGRCPIVVIHKLCVDQPRVYHTTSCIDAVFRMLQSQVLGQDITRRTSRFFVGHRPPSRLPSRLPDVTHVTLSPRPSPPFLYCKRSKLEPGTAWERGYAMRVNEIPVLRAAPSLSCGTECGHARLVRNNGKHLPQFCCLY